MEKTLSLFYVFTAFLFLFFPELKRDSAALSLVAVKNIVLATLFPMMVLCRAFSGTSLMRKLSLKIGKTALWRKLSLSDTLIPPVLCGIISGFPASAREIEKAVAKGAVTKKEGEKALALSSAPSPAFVIGVAGKTPLHGALLFFISLTLSYITAYALKTEKSPAPISFPSLSFSSALSSSVSSALSVGGNIVFFTLVTSLFSFLPSPLTPFMSAVTELGSGVVALKECPFFLAFLTGWGGISALSQIKSEAPSLRAGLYIKARLLTAFSFVLIEFIFF